jgi:hypothetical protein
MSRVDRVIVPQSPSLLVQFRDAETRIPDSEAAQPAGEQKILVVISAIRQCFPEIRLKSSLTPVGSMFLIQTAGGIQIPR